MLFFTSVLLNARPKWIYGISERSIISRPEWFVHEKKGGRERKLSSRSMHVPRCFVEEDRGKRKKEERLDGGCCLEASPAKCPLTMAKRVLGPVKG